MCKMYDRLKALCDEKGITGYKMCKDTGMQPSIMTDLKAGRKHTLSAKSMAKVAEYFGVTIEYLMSGSDRQKDDLSKSQSEDPVYHKVYKYSGSIGHDMLFKSADDATEDELIQTANYLNFLKSKRKD